jgi:hypothetical protein
LPKQINAAQEGTFSPVSPADNADHVTGFAASDTPLSTSLLP